MNERYLKVLGWLEQLLKRNPQLYEHFGKNYAYIPSAYFTMPVITDITQKIADDLNNGNTYITDTAVRLFMFLGNNEYKLLYEDIKSLLGAINTDILLPDEYLERLELFNTEETFNTISVTLITLFCLEQAVSNINSSEK